MSYQRREERLAPPVPLALSLLGRGRDGAVHTFEGEILDTSKMGLKLRVGRFFDRRTVLFLTLPFSYAFKAYRFSGPTYHTHATVAYSKECGPGLFEVGVELQHDY